MIVDTPPRITVNCNGSLKTFTFSFPLIVSSDLVVKLKNTTANVIMTLAETTDYVVADPNGVTGVLANYANGGTITTTAELAYSAIYQITMERAVPYTQAQDYTEGMQTLYENFEAGLDKLTMLVRQVRDISGRSPYCPADDPTRLDMVMPNAAARANKVLAFDADGKPVAGAEAPNVTVTTFGDVGSSPRLRGTLPWPNPFTGAVRFIPASAGNTSTALQLTGLASVKSQGNSPPPGPR